jgi:peptidyl-prolyl cis-trans isomerase SurA
MIFRLLTAVLFSCFLLSPTQAQTRRAQPVEVDRIVAVVNDDAITAFELRTRLAMVERQLRAQNVQLPPRDALERQLLERMITDRVQLQFAKETGLRISDIELDTAMRRIAEGNRLSLQDFRATLERDGISWAKFREEIRDEITLSRLREREVESRILVSDGEIDNYLANPDQGRQYRQCRGADSAHRHPGSRTGLAGPVDAHRCPGAGRPRPDSSR